MYAIRSYYGFNPMLGTWTMVASHRQNRPQMPKNWCPFCPGSGKVPESYDVHKYDNDFPALSASPPEPDPVGSDFYKAVPAYGACEVILYSSDHTKTLHELPVPHIRKLVDLWVDRVADLSSRPTSKYVIRITSYNVCYTKLLRSATPGAASRRPGFPSPTFTAVTWGFSTSPYPSCSEACTRGRF